MADGPITVNSIVGPRLSMQNTVMFLRILMLGLMLLAGCQPLEIYHQPGVAVSLLENDTTACRLSSAQSVPPKIEIRQHPPRFIPARRICDAQGDCFIRGGYFIEGELYSVDVNAELRDEVMDQCMANKGYVPVTIPRCKARVARSVPEGHTVDLPVLSDQSCFIRNRDKTWQIVEPHRPKDE